MALDGVHGTVCNAEQYQRSLPSYDNPNPTVSCLTHGQSIGLAFTAEASFLSLVCVTVVLIRIGFNVLWYRRNFPEGDWKLFRTPSDIYMLSLFIFDILLAMGNILDVRWAHNGIVTIGPYCTAQGIIQQIGDLGVALITLVILAIHTFITALWRVGLHARGTALGLVSLTGIFTVAWVGIGSGTHKNFETPTPYWCWISPQFPSERLGGEYIWFWMALLASTVLYVPLYFWAKGRLSVDTERWYKLRVSKPDQSVEYAPRRAALGILCYPLAYSLVILPVSVTRWLQFHNKHIPSAATFFSDSMFCLSGAINVLLFLIIRPQLLLFTRPELGEPQMDVAPRSTGLRVNVLHTPESEHNRAPLALRFVGGASRSSEARPLGRFSRELYV